MKLKKMRWFLPNCFHSLEYMIKSGMLSSPWFMFSIYSSQNTHFIPPCKVQEGFLQRGLNIAIAVFRSCLYPVTIFLDNSLVFIALNLIVCSVASWVRRIWTSLKNVCCSCSHWTTLKPQTTTWNQSGVKPESAALWQGHPLGKAEVA